MGMAAFCGRRPVSPRRSTPFVFLTTLNSCYRASENLGGTHVLIKTMKGMVALCKLGERTHLNAMVIF